jgi:hypothetical protein
MQQSSIECPRVAQTLRLSQIAKLSTLAPSLQVFHSFMLMLSYNRAMNMLVILVATLLGSSNVTLAADPTSGT